MKFNIIEFDNDYHTIASQVVMEFTSKEEADEYCDEESWTGYRYHAKELDDNA